MSRSALSYIFGLLLLFISYYLTATVGLQLDAVSGFASLVWPPTGIALAFLLIFGRRLWPAIFFAAFLVNYHTGAPFVAAIGIALGNTLEAVVGAYFLNRVGFQKSVERLVDVFALIFIAALGSTLVSATIGVFSLFITRVITLSVLRDTWLAWWIGDVLGDLVIAPFILVLWSKRKSIQINLKNLADVLLFALMLEFIYLVVFRGVFGFDARNSPLTYLTLLPLIWASLKYGQIGATASTFLLSTLSIWSTAQGYGPFTGKSLLENLYYLQTFIAVASATTLTIGASVSERKKFELSLEQSKQRFRALIENSYDAISLATPEGIISYTSPSTKRILGYEPSEFVGRNMLYLIHPGDKEVSTKLAQLFKKPGEIVRAEFRVLHKDDHWRWIEVVAVNLLQESGVNAIVINYRDITDRRLAEEELHKRGEEFKALADNSPDLVSRFDRSLRHLYVNYAVERATNIPVQMYIGKTDEEMGMSKELVDYWKENILEVFKSGRERIIEFDFTSKQGVKTYYQARLMPEFARNGSIAYVLGVSRDVTDLKQLGERLAEERDRLRAIIDSMEEGLFVVDKDQKITLINNAARKMLQATSEALTGQDIKQIVTLSKGNKDIPVTERPIVKVFKTGLAIVTSLKDDLYYQTHTGKKFPVIISVAPLADGQTTGAINVFRDVSEQKALDKMKSEFLSVAAHQLRSPLGSMRWNIEMLLSGKGEPLGAVTKKTIEQIYKSDLRMILLVNDLLNVSRIDAGKVVKKEELLDVFAELKRVMAEFDVEAKARQITISLLKRDESIPKIFFDTNQFHEIFNNLTSNAIKYNKPEGKVLITVSSDGHFVGIEVKDTGIGIPRGDQTKIFSKFFRASNALLADTEGTGLGLYVVKSYVEDRGGSVRLTSDEGKGTIVNISLPVAK